MGAARRGQRNLPMTPGTVPIVSVHPARLIPYILEVVEDRSGLRSTVLTSQLPVAMWHDAIGEPTLADAVLDRLLENLQRVELQGDSMRKTSSGRPGAKATRKPQ